MEKQGALLLYRCRLFLVVRVDVVIFEWLHGMEVKVEDNVSFSFKIHSTVQHVDNADR